MPSWCIWSMASIISIHAPARGATPPGYTECTTTGNFNPRSREGSDDLPDRQPAERDDFNPRSREGSDVIQFVLQAEFIKFQSTLPRGERLETQKTSGSQSEISIHAPARGATYSPHEIKERLQINFNPRSREGSDLFSVIHLCSLQDFNPRSREGSDVYIPLWIHLQHISIHAPARGATPFGRIFRLFAAISIHAPARGATKKQGGNRPEYSISIHAPARGATGNLRSTGDSGKHFNPRSREGSDGELAEPLSSRTISIHAPARGATFPKAMQIYNHYNFNPRSREGSDRKSRRSRPITAISIHAPARGATLHVRDSNGFPEFQSTLPRGQEPPDSQGG